LPGNGKLKGSLVQNRFPVLDNNLASRLLSVLGALAVQLSCFYNKFPGIRHQPQAKNTDQQKMMLYY
jgi:hypothetical protein